MIENKIKDVARTFVFMFNTNGEINNEDLFDLHYNMGGDDISWLIIIAGYYLAKDRIKDLDTTIPGFSNKEDVWLQNLQVQDDF